MRNDWVIIFKSSDKFEIQMKSQILKSNEIDNVVLDKMDSSYLLNFGSEIQILVSKKDLSKARKILNSIENK